MPSTPKKPCIYLSFVTFGFSFPIRCHLKAATKPPREFDLNEEIITPNNHPYLNSTSTNRVTPEEFAFKWENAEERSLNCVMDPGILPFWLLRLF